MKAMGRFNPQPIERNVYDYFMARMGERSTDRSLLDLPIDSQCGEDCVAVIEAGAQLLPHLRRAFGYDHAEYAFLIRQIDYTIQCYWRG